MKFTTLNGKLRKAIRDMATGTDFSMHVGAIDRGDTPPSALVYLRKLFEFLAPSKNTQVSRIVGNFNCVKWMGVERIQEFLSIFGDAERELNTPGKGSLMTDEEIAEKLGGEIYKEPRLQVLATTYLNAPKGSECKTKKYLIEGLEAFIDRERREENDLAMSNMYQGINNNDGKGFVAKDNGGGSPAPAAVDPFQAGKDPWTKGGSKGGQGNGWKGGTGAGKGKLWTEEEEARMRKPVESGEHAGKHRCTFYDTRTGCGRTNCTFAHVDGLTEGEKQALWFITMSKRQQTEKINQPCWQNIKGKCNRGNGCKFMHDPTA